MPFLKLNNWEPTLEVESRFRIEHPESNIDRYRTFDFDLIESERGDYKRVWRGSSTILSPSDAAAFVGLIKGRGHRVAFTDDVYSSRGLGPAAGSNYTHASGFVTIASGDFIKYAPGITSIPDDYTIVHSKRVSGTWRRYAHNSLGSEYLDGVSGSYNIEPNWVTVAGDGTVRFEGKDTAGTNAETYYDNIVWLPFAATNAMLEAFSSAATSSELPYLAASGDAVPGGATVRGIVLDEELMPAVVGGVYYANATRVSFELVEK